MYTACQNGLFREFCRLSQAEGQRGVIFALLLVLAARRVPAAQAMA